MTLSAIHPDGGENFRLYMGLQYLPAYKNLYLRTC